ncbi:MAG: family 20 glycosylhydrolase [Bacteroidota bacterium]
MKNLRLILPLLTAFYMNLYGQEISIHVSPHGDDGNEGTTERPVATIEKAQYLIREAKNQHEPEEPVSIILHEGVFRLKKGIVLNEEDSGTEKAPLVISSHEGDNVTISGAIPIESYEQLSKGHPLYKKDPVTGSKIIEIDLQKAGLSLFKQMRLSGFSGNEVPKSYTLKELHFKGKPMPLSRWPNKGFSEFTDIISDSSETVERIGIVYKDQHISTWNNEPNILLHGYWKYLWADAYEQVSQIDTASKVIWLSPPYNHYNFQKNHPFAAFNVIAEIDQPGEWAYDYQKRKIYFYPPDDITPGSLELSICEDPLLVLKNTQWVTFKDICFEMGAGEGIQISNSSNINIDNCEVHACAREGITMNGGTNNTISSCEIYDTGRGAITVSGGNRETLEKSGFHIDNCHIHNLSRIDRTYTPGIWVDGVGTRITHCEVHDVPSSAMRINGNDHTIEYNEMYQVVTESDDQGAIDMWGDPTYRGNVFRYNYIHDVGPYGEDEVNAHCGRAGIRFDDAISGNLIYANIFRNCSGGLFGAIQIHGGKENLIRNNLIYQCSAGISFSPWNDERWRNFMKMMNDRGLGLLDFFERNKELYISRYPELGSLNEDINKNTVERNVFLECDETTLRKPEATTLNNNLVIDVNPGLKDIEKNNYSLKNINQDLKKIKFEPIPFEKIGLKEYSNLRSQNIPVIPTPNEIKTGKETFTIDQQTHIACLDENKEIAAILQAHIKRVLGVQIEIIRSEKSGSGNIQFELNKKLAKEAYELIVSKKGIQIIASNNRGWFYGVQSLIQLISVEIPAVTIKDAPRFSWRAFMLDEARYFKGMDQVKMLLDEMALLKMNIFHWHLVDDQGWRIEIKKYPLLTQIGSKRKSTQAGGWKSQIQTAEPHEGFYTQEEIKEIVNYAKERYITIVPEIEMPGHSSAAIASYPWLGTAKKEIEVPIRWGVGTDVYDVSDPEVYQFLTDVLDEVMELFPSQVIHIGGDEVKYDHWKASDSVQEYMKETGLSTPAELQVFFTNRISQYLQSKGRRMMGWNEIMGHNLHEYQDETDTNSKQQLAKTTVVHFWKGDVKLATEAASNGFEIVNSLHLDTYLDYSYSSIPLSKAYAFDPIPVGLDPKYHDKVIGTGCQMWGEHIPTNGHMHFQVFPRIAAYAEVGWTEKKHKNFESFRSSLPNLQKRWEHKGIYYAPDSVVENLESKQ